MTAPIRPHGPTIPGLTDRPRTIDLGPVAGEPSFGDVFRRAINDASAAQDGAKDMIASFLRGEPVELHQVMAASEEAQLSLEFLVEIRNKLAEAYRSVMNTQT
ncbi:MAG: flagellar hook-basal body complex protein FliE [Gemmatimonadota bacterium]